MHELSWPAHLCEPDCCCVSGDDLVAACTCVVVAWGTHTSKHQNVFGNSRSSFWEGWLCGCGVVGVVRASYLRHQSRRHKLESFLLSSFRSLLCCTDCEDEVMKHWRRFAAPQRGSATMEQGPSSSETEF